MTSWSYQSTNPCTVLVKEKQDGQSPFARDCPPPILQSSTETAAPSQDQPEISSSLGNSIGGKKGRIKRQAHEDGVVDVVFDDGEGHDEHSSPNNKVEKRILVNISIAMDSGLGSPHHDVYQLQVAVPLPKQPKKHQNFYAYDVDGNAAEIVTLEKLIKNETSALEAELEAPTEMPTEEPPSTTLDYSSTTDFEGESSSTNSDDFIATSSTDPEGLRN